jgi:hypothetical protein
MLHWCLLLVYIFVIKLLMPWVVKNQVKSVCAIFLFYLFKMNPLIHNFLHLSPLSKWRALIFVEHQFSTNLIDLEFGKHFRSMTKKVKTCITKIIIYEYNQILASLKEGLDIHPLTSICTKSRRLVAEVNTWNINGKRCFPKTHPAHKGNWVCNFLGGRPLAKLYQVACVVVK